MGHGVLRGPGTNNWDISVYKNIRLREGKMNAQLRFETYNTFNHTQFSSVNTAARFQPNGQQVNALFGTVVATRSPRVMQGSLRFTF